MFINNFKYSFKVLIRNKGLIFWTFAFPILLGLFFYLAFSDIENKENFKQIDIAVIENREFQNDEFYKEAMKELSDKNNSSRIFNTKYVSKKDAEEKLKNKKISGYLEFTNDNVNITVNSSGVNETIIKYVVSELKSDRKIMNDLVRREVIKSQNNSYDKIINYEEIYNNVIKILNKDNVKLNNISNKNLSYTMIEYYTLIAMACLYGSMLSMYITNFKLANMNSVGKRTSLSPTSKTKLLLSSLLSSYLVQLIGLTLLFIFTIFVIKVDYGNNLPLVISLSLVGSLSGLTLGVFVSSKFKVSEGSKIGILISVIMLGSFLSGMMGITMKYVIDKNIPIINKLNPVNMITDGLYSLYYYNTLDRYYFNIISLVIFSIIMMILSINSLRRQKYDSV